MPMTLFERMSRLAAAPAQPATRYCKRCGLGPREWMECEEVDCDIETQEEADARAARAGGEKDGV